MLHSSVFDYLWVRLKNWVTLIYWTAYPWFIYFLQVKIQGNNEDMLHSACELFLGKSEREIRTVAQETLEGHQRAIMGNMTVEVITHLCQTSFCSLLICWIVFGVFGVGLSHWDYHLWMLYNWCWHLAGFPRCLLAYFTSEFLYTYTCF